MPPELASLIEKKWPGSKAVTVEGKFNEDHATLQYKIVRDQSVLGWAFTRRVMSCRNGGCDGPVSMNEEVVLHEYFDYFALLNPEFSILEIKVYNYSATHGQEICSKAWLKQFKGYNGSKKLRYGKEIDAISGATISGRAITEDIATTVGLLLK